MKRSLQGTVAILALCIAMPVAAADAIDYPDLRPAYPDGWENTEDSIRFEFGARYWLSWGSQDAGLTAKMGPVTLGDVTISTDDQTHIGELHGKIEDLSTQTYLAGRAGLGLSTSGTYAISPASPISPIGPHSVIGYAGADFGWLPLGTMDEGFAFGGLVGYHYWKDAPDIGSGQYAASLDGLGLPATFGAAKDDFDIHALRLGVRATAEYDMFDLQAEVAAVPYAHISGSVGGSATASGGSFDFPPFGSFYERAPTTLTGRGYGVMAETMVGFHPTENLAVRLGGRAWYLEGQLDAVFKAHGAPDLPLSSNFARIFRYGLMAEMTGKF